MPYKPLFSQIFGRSPVSLIQNHMEVASEASRLLPDFYAALLTQDWNQAQAIGRKIQILEGKADDIKREVRANLSSSLFMPVSRSDLLELIKAQDRVPNRAKDIVGLSLGRRMEFPQEVHESLKSFVASAVAAVDIALGALNELGELFVSGFSGVEVQAISNMITRLSAVEHETDLHQRKVQDILYKLEKSLPPIDVMFLYRTIDWIGDIADDAQSVGNRMLYLIAK